MQAKRHTIIYWTLFVCNQWNVYIAATSKGLCFVGSKDFDELVLWAERKFPQHTLVQDDKVLHPYVAELEEYIKGDRKKFTMPIDVQGTPFQLAVWNALCEIPYGETYSYSDIAERIQKPDSVRAVGTAIGANPVLITIPCHRVIGKTGKLTGFRGGLEMKKQLLSLEKESSCHSGKQ
ncbi:methylated-DNA--[protein]-cysteine S-methyltransferase [Bacillus atrophaeus]|uniref:methylated-DNA--[protein]-cysteine S-methyltransferase n=1 Tax=Bacillus atrophaeus TaxID=1452 RepID=UPI00227E12A0|nr:methylated-DNA--[protein]-cysteine S-methyltransferase [Bacillus atrophaeus]MCY8521901.1 methylated-DNA--[protein]-cysteine S-methyltransferase [Bacillus atrophaeus]MCY8525460.1 methylated-DNA--[protein]-cysteine S-methyltransferase [Bacillus atrophaeus]